MRIPLTSISASGLAFVTLGGVSLAQPIAAPPQAAGYDPQQFPAIHGELDRFTLTAGGEIDGFILKNGTEVKTAPDLSTQIAFAIKPGDRVTIRGLKAAALPLLTAVSVTDEITHHTVTDSGASGRPAPLPRGTLTQFPGAVSETSGRVRMLLHGPQGEINGVLLESGVMLRLPPDHIAQLSTLIQPSQPVVAEGTSITNAMGTVVEVEQIGPSRDRLIAAGPAGSHPPPTPPADRAPQPPPPPPPAV